MNQKYFINKNAQSNGDHELHVLSCDHLPDSYNMIFVGYFFSCKDAIKEAKKYYDDVDGCYYCCNQCHKE